MMKKICALLTMLLLLTGCGRNVPVDRPHTMEVVYGESSIFAKTSGYSWNWKQGKDPQSAIADMEDPRALMGELPWLSANGQTEIALEFAQKPQTVEVIRWSSVDDYATSQPVEVTELSLEAPQDENSYLYSISASWKEGGKNWGECTYNFMFLPQGVVASPGGENLEFTQLAGDLTLAEVLTLKPADLFGVEISWQNAQGQVKTCRNQKDKSAVLDFLQSNLSADFVPVETAPVAEFLMRLACVDGRQVTVGYGASNGTAWVIVGDVVYEAQPMDFASLWEELGATAVSQEVVAMGPGYLAVGEALSEDHWGDDFVYAYVREVSDKVVYDEMRWIDDSEAFNGYRLEPGWKDQEKVLAEDAEFWVLNRDAETYDQMTAEGLDRYLKGLNYNILLRLHLEGDTVAAISQKYVP